MSAQIAISIKRLHPAALAPRYAHTDDAAMDLFAPESFILTPSERKLVGIGWAIEFPAGFVGRIVDRSGLAAKQGVHVLAGVIDAGFRGEWGVLLINHGTEIVTFEAGDRIAQVIFLPIVTAVITETETLSDSTRGQGGFGSTGK